MTAAGTTGRLTAFDRDMLTYMNQARAAAGAPALEEATGLVNVAVSWSTQLSNGHTGYTLEHNPNAWDEVAANGASNRTFWGENVAWSSSSATTARSIFDAYMASPGHRANILNASFRYVGVGTVSGDHGLWNSQEFTDRVEPGQVVTTPQPTVIGEGDFVQVQGQPAVFRIAGGAALWVTSWAPFGGQQSIKSITQTQFNALRTYPADGTFINDTNWVYRIAGGAPIYVTSWANVGGGHSSTFVDPAVIANAGRGGLWNNLRSTPADGTVINDGVNTYRIAGGAPIVVTNWANIGGQQPSTLVDRVAVSYAGRGGAWNSLLAQPVNGTFISDGTHAYRVAGGAAIYVAGWASVGGQQPATMIDRVAIENAGRGGAWNGLRAFPLDGTLLSALNHPTIYRVISGVPLALSSWNEVGGPQPTTVVSLQSIQMAGSGGVYRALLR